MRIDSQCHVSPNWYEPVDVLLFHMDRQGVERSVLIQMLGQYDNAYLAACCAAHPDRLLSVVGIDPANPRALEQLRREVEEGARGLRLRPGARSPGSDPLAIWRVAEECGIAVSCVGSVETFNAPEFAEVVSAVPRLPIVLEHFAGQARPDESAQAKAARLQGLSLARFGNVFLKIPGLAELLPRTAPLPAEGSALVAGGSDLVDAAVEAFGAERLLWGSDFPVVSSREGYGNALSNCQVACAHLDDEQRDWIFGGTANAVFRAG